MSNSDMRGHTPPGPIHLGRALPALALGLYFFAEAYYFALPPCEWPRLLADSAQYRLEASSRGLRVRGAPLAGGQPFAFEVAVGLLRVTVTEGPATLAEAWRLHRWLLVFDAGGACLPAVIGRSPAAPWRATVWQRRPGAAGELLATVNASASACHVRWRGGGQLHLWGALGCYNALWEAPPAGPALLALLAPALL